MTRLTANASAFAREHVSRVVGVATGRLPADEALEERVFREISRLPEVESPTRDQWGNWEFALGESNARGELYVPWLDRPLAELRRRLAAEHPEWTFEPAWPEGRAFAVCLTHDVDYVTRNPGAGRIAGQAVRDLGLLLAGSASRAESSVALHGMTVAGFQLAVLRPLRPRPERTYEAWLAAEDRHGFKSTFFFFPERLTAPHVFDCSYGYGDAVGYAGRRTNVRGMMREMRAAGWELGLHGSYHSALRPGLLADQRRQVSDAAGVSVTSTRQHWLHYDTRRTPRLQRDAGLLADSTQGFNRNVGFRAGTAFPHACWDFEADRALDLLEVPMHVMDGALFSANALEYDAERAVRHCVRLMDEVESVGGCLTLNWHPHVINDDTYWSVYETVLAEAARRRAWGCSVEMLREWWLGRAKRINGESSVAVATVPDGAPARPGA